MAIKPETVSVISNTNTAKVNQTRSGLIKKQLKHERLKDFSKNRTQRKHDKYEYKTKTIKAREIGKTIRALGRNAAEMSIARSQAIKDAGTKAAGISEALNQEVVRSQGADSTDTGSAKSNTSMNYEDRVGDDR